MIKAGTLEGAQHTPATYSQAKLTRVYQRFHSKNMLRNKNFAPGFSCLILKSVHTRELALETRSCSSFAPGACSLILNQFDMKEENQGANVLLRNIFFRVKSLVHTRELAREHVARVAGAKLPRVYRPY